MKLWNLHFQNELKIESSFIDVAYGVIILLYPNVLQYICMKYSATNKIA
jgi:hypothetical protein